MVGILDVQNNIKIKAGIIPADKIKMPLKKDGWNFNWKQLIKSKNTTTYILKLVDPPQTIEGVLQLKIEEDMLIMDLIEIAPHNGQKKRYTDVAGCLISYACRESLKVKGDYQGFLSFVAKTDLIEWYSKKYGATHAFGQRMYIDPETGLELIEKYLNDNLK